MELGRDSQVVHVTAWKVKAVHKKHLELLGDSLEFRLSYEAETGQREISYTTVSLGAITCILS